MLTSYNTKPPKTMVLKYLISNCTPSFIFLTQEGTTTAPNLEDIENLQLLRITNGETSHQTFENLLRENEWIKEADYSEAMALELKAEKPEIFNLGSKNL